jgi:hypothetical protein
LNWCVLLILAFLLLLNDSTFEKGEPFPVLSCSMSGSCIDVLESRMKYKIDILIISEADI